MRAAEELAKRQRESPLGPSGDRVLQAFQSLPQLADPAFERIVSSGIVAAGEMNSRQPNAKTFHLPDGTHLITIFTGLIEFYESVCQILLGATNLHTREGVLEANPVAAWSSELEALFRRWTPKGIAEQTASAEIGLELPEEKKKLAKRHLDAAILFVLCHELGHVLYFKRNEETEDVASLTREQELASDIAGMKTAVRSAPSAWEARLNLGACVMSLRVLAVFAEMGHPFTGYHPDPLTRRNSLFAQLREWCDSPCDYWWLTSIAYANDELLETAGQHATGGPALLPIRADRTFSRLCSAIEEVIRGRKEKSILVPLMERELEEASPEVLGKVADFMAELTVSASFSSQCLWQGWGHKVALFMELQQQWPQRFQTALGEAFSVAQANKQELWGRAIMKRMNIKDLLKINPG